jgi:hypothetical protein
MVKKPNKRMLSLNIKNSKINILVICHKESPSSKIILIHNFINCFIDNSWKYSQVYFLSLYEAIDYI